jgi:hypothetical protein
MISAAADLQLEKTSTNPYPRRTKGLQTPKKSSSYQVYTGQWLPETTSYDKPKMQKKENMKSLAFPNCKAS